MALTPKQIALFREELDSCTRPLFLFDDDPDGLCSFLLLYRYKKEGYGVVVKSLPELGPMFLNKVKEFMPDKIFVLDKPKISDHFIAEAGVPIVMLDHHQPISNREKIKYFNPRLNDDADNRSTSYWCYQIVQQDLWVATIGCISDWQVPDFFPDFRKHYPHLVTRHTTPDGILFNSPLGKVCRIFSFLLKGPTKDVKAAIKELAKINSPEELLNPTTSESKKLIERFSTINEEYEHLMQSVVVTKDPILLFTYSEKNMSFTSDLSNELLFKYPKKVILVCRERSGEMRCSIRSAQYELPDKIQHSLSGLRGYGGGHTHACGASIAKDDFPVFLSRLKAQLEK